MKKSAHKTQKVSDKKMDKSVQIFGVTIFGTQMRQVLSKVGLQRKEMLHIATVNPEYVMEARGNSQFREILAHCLTVADGHGVVWALRLAQGKQIERISGVELVEEILKLADERGEKVFLLGAQTGIAEKAALEMASKYPHAHFMSYAGAQTVKVEKSEEASMTIAKINGFEPDYLLVAYGSPWQDIWIEENRPYLRVRVAMGVGGTLDEWAGVVANCLARMDKIGLKWMWRVLREPWRVPRITRVFQFAALVVFTKLKALLRQGFGG